MTSSREINPAMIHRILVRAPNWIGDAVMCTPALQGIRETFSSAEICVLARSGVAQLLRNHSSVDRIIEYQHHGQHSGLFGRWRLAQEVRSLACDLAILFPNSFDAGLIAFMAGIPRRVGFATDGRSIFLTHAVALPSEAKKMHQVKYYEALIKSICSNYSSYPSSLSISDDDKAQAIQLFANHDIADDDVVLGLNPGSVYGGAKRWLPERFAEAADQIVNNVVTQEKPSFSVRWVIVGAPGEERLGREIANHMQTNPVVLSGKTSLGVLKSVIQRCRLFLTNDTGPMHIANAFGIPVVAVFGPTDHTTTSPYGENYVLVRKSVECSPCMLRECPIDHQCMTGVTVEQVVQAANKILKLNKTVPHEQVQVNP